MSSLSDTHMRAQATRDERAQDSSRLRVWDRRRLISAVLLLVAAAAVIASMALPYWGLTLHAPQYPRGLTIQATISEMRGEVFEVDGLNHYIGMMKLGDAAKLERQISRFAIPVLAVLALASIFVRGRWKWLLVLPLAIYPVVFIGDLAAWLYYAGHSLDPTAALSTSIKPFTPRVLGVGKIGQFSTVAHFATGYYLALASSVLALVATYIARKGERHV